MSSARHPKALPRVMSVNLGMRDPDDLRWWGVNVSVIISISLLLLFSHRQLD